MSEIQTPKRRLPKINFTFVRWIERLSASSSAKSVFWHSIEEIDFKLGCEVHHSGRSGLIVETVHISSFWKHSKASLHFVWEINFRSLVKFLVAGISEANLNDDWDRFLTSYCKCEKGRVGWNIRSMWNRWGFLFHFFLKFGLSLTFLNLGDGSRPGHFYRKHSQFGSESCF